MGKNTLFCASTSESETSSIEKLNDFLDRYPTGDHTEEVQMMILHKEEESAFGKLSKESAADELQSFISNYPDSAHTKQVNQWLKKALGEDRVALWAWIVFPLIGAAAGVALKLFV